MPKGMIQWCGKIKHLKVNLPPPLTITKRGQNILAIFSKLESSKWGYETPLYCKQKLYVTALGTYEQILFENLRGLFYFHQINLQRQMKIFCHMKTPVNLSSISWMTESFHWRSMAISLSPMPMVLPDLSMSRAPKAQLILRKGVVVRC